MYKVNKIPTSNLIPLVYEEYLYHVALYNTWGCLS